VTDEAAEWRQEYLKEHRQAKLFAAEVERLTNKTVRMAADWADEVKRLRAALVYEYEYSDDLETVKRLRQALEEK
jgi:hypothetical protein